jgi:hypothetical protein
MKTKTTCLALAAIALLASCKKEESAANTPASPAASGPSQALSQVLGTSPTGEAKPIHLIRATAKPGDEITVSGKIMGNASPFVEGRSVFILGDPEVLTACNEDPADKCTTPWDNCCDSKEDKKRGTATVQVVDKDGRVLKEPIEGVGGLAKLADVTVSGKVAEGSSADLLIINAQAIRTAK